MKRREFLALAIGALGASAFKLKGKGLKGSIIFTSSNPKEALKRLSKEMGGLRLIPADEETRRLLALSGSWGSGTRALVFLRELPQEVETSITYTGERGIEDPRKRYSRTYSFLRREGRGRYLVTLVFERASSGKARAVVEVEGRRAMEIDLSRDGQYEVMGREGKMTLEVSRGKIRAVESSCKKKICVKTGFISSPHEKIVCIPNRVIVSIEGSGLDGVSF